MVTDDSFRASMRRLAAGVSIISARGAEGPQGITATAITSLSPDPPSILACVNKSLLLSALIRDTSTFGVNVLREEHAPLARRFAGMDGVRGPEKFTAGSWIDLPSGAPGLADGLVVLDCTVDRIVESSTHVILVGLITDIRHGEEGEPLVYCDGTFTGLRPLVTA